MLIRFVRQWGSHRPGTTADLGGSSELLVRRGFAEVVTDDPPAAVVPANKKLRAVKVRAKAGAA